MGVFNTLSRSSVTTAQLADKIDSDDEASLHKQDLHLKGKRDCGGGVGGGEWASARKRKPCPQCGKEMDASNLSRHLKGACKGGEANL